MSLLTRCLLMGARRILPATRLETAASAAWSARPMSMWPPEFEEPVPHLSEFPTLRESDEFERKSLVPIKSAPKDATCSVLTGDPLVNKVRNMVMRHSDRENADLTMRRTFHLIKAAQIRRLRRAPEDRRDQITTDPAAILRDAVENARPLLSLQRVRVGAVVYNVPAPITEERSVFEGIRWLIGEARDRDKKESFFFQKFADVLMDTAAYTGKVVAKKHEHHRICEQNRAYAHYRKTM